MPLARILSFPDGEVISSVEAISSKPSINSPEEALGFIFGIANSESISPENKISIILAFFDELESLI